MKPAQQVQHSLPIAEQKPVTEAIMAAAVDGDFTRLIAMEAAPKARATKKMQKGCPVCGSMGHRTSWILVYADDGTEVPS